MQLRTDDVASVCNLGARKDRGSGETYARGIVAVATRGRVVIRASTSRVITVQRTPPPGVFSSTFAETLFVYAVSHLTKWIGSLPDGDLLVMLPAQRWWQGPSRRDQEVAEV
ncbi:MAG: hypothetical protein ACYCXT_12760 [Acidiferrobacteraceae bacterium]